jgi:hypothetical protein
MPRPQAYDPQDGYMFQILVRTPYDRAYESLDHAVDKSDLKHLLTEYGLVYRGQPHEFKTIRLPQKYWKKKVS